MNKETWCSIDIIHTEYSVENILYDASDLTVELARYDNGKILRVKFCNVMAYRVTLEQFRWADTGIDGKTTPLYEIRNSNYIEWIMNCGMQQLYGSSMLLKHFAIKTTEHVIDVITTEMYSISE